MPDLYAEYLLDASCVIKHKHLSVLLLFEQFGGLTKCSFSTSCQVVQISPWKLGLDVEDWLNLETHLQMLSSKESWLGEQENVHQPAQAFGEIKSQNLSLVPKEGGLPGVSPATGSGPQGQVCSWLSSNSIAWWCTLAQNGPLNTLWAQGLPTL